MLLKHPNEMFSWIWMIEEKCSSNTNTAACTYRHGQMVNSGALKKAQLFFQWVSLSFIPVVRRQWGVKQKTLNPKHLLMDTRLNPGLIVLGSQGRVTPDQMMRQAWGRERAPIEPMHMEMSPNDQYEIPWRKKAACKIKEPVWGEGDVWTGPDGEPWIRDERGFFLGGEYHGLRKLFPMWCTMPDVELTHYQVLSQNISPIDWDESDCCWSSAFLLAKQRIPCVTLQNDLLQNNLLL